MNTRSVIIGIIFVIIVVALGLTLAKRLPKISILDSLRSRFSLVKNRPTLLLPQVSPTESVSIPSITKDSNLIKCSSALVQQNCQSFSKETVCGYQKTVHSDGISEEGKLEYISACYFCKLFGSDGVLEMGENRVYAIGYKIGSCN